MLPVMEISGIVRDGCIVLPPSVHLREGTAVRVIVEDPRADVSEPYEREPLSEESVLADIAWATGKRFGA